MYLCLVMQPFRVQVVGNDAEMNAALAVTGAQATRIIVPMRFDYPVVDSVIVTGATAATKRFLFVRTTMARVQVVPQDQADRFNEMIALCGGVEQAALALFVPPSLFDAFIATPVPGYQGSIFKISV